RRREATRKLGVQTRQVTTELVREGLDHSELLRRQDKLVQRVPRDRLLRGLSNPPGSRLTGDNRDREPIPGDRDTAREGLNDRRLLHLRDDLRGDLLRQEVRNVRSSTRNVDHDWSFPGSAPEMRGEELGKGVRGGRLAFARTSALRRVRLGCLRSVETRQEQVSLRGDGLLVVTRQELHEVGRHALLERNLVDRGLTGDLGQLGLRFLRLPLRLRQLGGAGLLDLVELGLVVRRGLLSSSTGLALSAQGLLSVGAERRIPRLALRVLLDVLRALHGRASRLRHWFSRIAR